MYDVYMYIYTYASVFSCLSHHFRPLLLVFTAERQSLVREPITRNLEQKLITDIFHLSTSSGSSTLTHPNFMRSQKVKIYEHLYCLTWILAIGSEIISLAFFILLQNSLLIFMSYMVLPIHGLKYFRVPIFWSMTSKQSSPLLFYL